MPRGYSYSQAERAFVRRYAGQFTAEQIASMMVAQGIGERSAEGIRNIAHKEQVSLRIRRPKPKAKPPRAADLDLNESGIVWVRVKPEDRPAYQRGLDAATRVGCQSKSEANVRAMIEFGQNHGV